MGKAITTVGEYLDTVPEDRLPTIKKLRALVRKHLPTGYKEAIRWGMIAYEIPLSVYPDTYNGEPLMYAGIASQKRHYGVYLCGVYSSEKVRDRFVAKWKKRGTRLDMGKSCIRLRNWEECEPDLIGEAIGSLSVKQFIKLAEAAHAKS